MARVVDVEYHYKLLLCFISQLLNVAIKRPIRIYSLATKGTQKLQTYSNSAWPLSVFRVTSKID
jgi:hypothetical protein